MFLLDDAQLEYAIECEDRLESYIRFLDKEGRLNLDNPRLKSLGQTAWLAWNNYWGVTDLTLDEHIAYDVERYREPDTIGRDMNEFPDLFSFA